MMKKYLTYCTTEFERFNRENHELIGVSYGYDIYDAKSDIQMYIKADMECDDKFLDCNIAVDEPLLLQTISASEDTIYNFMICGIAYPKYPASNNLVNYYGIIEIAE